MYNDRLYAGGVHSVLLAEWELLCKTPLVVRNGEQVSYSDSASSNSKTRYKELRMKWQRKMSPDHEVAALHYGYVVGEGKVSSYHFVAPSSIRGLLRAWSIRHLVPPALYPGLVPASNDDAEAQAIHDRCLKIGLNQSNTGFGLIASVFGLAAEDGESDHPSNAGRLRVETGKFKGSGLRSVDVSDISMGADEVGPDNVQRQMQVRSPLDRMTHAVVDKGLHHFLEVASGGVFKIYIRILNPTDNDLALLGLWAREMNDGLLRIGALTSIGRGRMEIQEPKYELWRRRNAPLLDGKDLLECENVEDRQADVLSGLWRCQQIKPEALLSFTKYLEEFIGGNIDGPIS
jgi:hypothetical protein